MSRNGAGTYNLPAGNPVVPATVISTTWANTTLNDMAAALTGSVAADGQTPITGDLQMSSNKITSLGAPVSANDATTKYYVDTAITVATGSLGTMSTQNANNVAITGGTITGLSSALPVASGGTGVTTSTGTGATVLGTSPTIASPTITGTVSNGTISTSSTTIIAGSSKAWVQFNSSGGVVGSYNVSSVTNNSTGLYTVNFTNAMSNGNYAAVACPIGTNNQNVMTYSFGTTSFQIYCQVATSAGYSNMAVAAAVFS
jgi:hypothetical protein